MLMEIEKEYKYLVNFEKFKAFLLKCNEKYLFNKHKIQANYYYDTVDNTLNKSRTTVRIRQQHSDLKLQIKKHRENKDGSATSYEYSEKIDTLPTIFKIPDLQDNLILKGVLITERKTYSFGVNSTICFDTNIYLGICDYEIEIEIGETDSQEALVVIEFLGLRQTPIMSKSERFFQRFEVMKNECDKVNK